ncbi:MAG: DNA polymerase III subunit delta [Gammaproteobacteria bacterium]|nr:MAG: DNA polymerase III subunit delta [Gammaproteobacteria bacterium]
MKIRPDQLAQHLKSDLLPVYLVSGDEPLQVMECSDAIRARARDWGCTEREVMTADQHFDWSLLLDAGNSLSLFAEKRILELRMNNGPGKTGSPVLQQYLERPAEDAILLITCGKLDGSSKNSKWFKALDQLGAVIQCWPVAAHELARWIEQRMRSKGLKPDAAAVSLLVERVEGNLLAAAQEIDKLVLLYGEKTITADDITAAVADSARYTIYDLVDSMLQGDLPRTARIVGGLQNEGVEQTLALWALSREIRLLNRLAESGLAPDAAMLREKVWDNRKALLKRALSRHNLPRLRNFLKRCARIDKVIKGVEAGRPWDEILLLTTQFAQTGTGTK